MSKAVQRRGVLMTASYKRPKPSWRDEASDEDETAEDAKASQLEWAQMEHEVSEQRRLRQATEEFAGGRRDGVVTDYDEVADDAGADDEVSAAAVASRAASLAEAGDSAAGGEAAVVAGPLPEGQAQALAPAQAGGEEGEEDEEGPLPPEGAVTAGRVSATEKVKKRGGKRKTGGRKRKQGESDDDGEEGAPKKKKKKDEDKDPDRWVNLKLEGEKKPKRIDATRVVHYHDFDTNRPSSSSSGPVPPAGNFRAQLARNMFAEEDDDDEEGV